MLQKHSSLPVLILLCLSLAACTGSNLAVQLGILRSTATVTATRTPRVTHRPVTATPSVTPVASRTPTVTATPSRTPTATATAVPLTLFTSRLIRPEISPQTYLEGTCEYLENRWDPDKAEPGTVVIPVMYHSIIPAGKAITDPNQVSEADFHASIEYAHAQGFETITMDQLDAFLTTNAYIPPRSMLLIVDDRKPGTIREAFMPYLERYDWTVTAAYITGPELAMDWAWREMLVLAQTGRVDIQAHGFLHNGSTYIKPYTPEDVTLRELELSRQLIHERLGYYPVAYIWPGGDYNRRALEMAREVGYRLGFTVRARGPVMYNWIPQGADELEAGDYLLTLPRYWSKDLIFGVDTALQLQSEAQADAAQNRSNELTYLQTYCTP